MSELWEQVVKMRITRKIYNTALIYVQRPTDRKAVTFH